MPFKDRFEAGKMLADRLKSFQKKDIVIFALPRGGVVVASQVARALKAPLELIITRKIGHPDQPEYAIAAISEGGQIVGDPLKHKDIDPAWLESKISEEFSEAKRRRQIYKPSLRAYALEAEGKISAKGKTAIIVDDGVATGLTILAAIKEIKSQNPKKIVLALPVAPFDILDKLKKEVNEIVCIYPEKDFFGAVGSYYENFPQVEDEEVVKIMFETSRFRSLE